MSRVHRIAFAAEFEDDTNGALPSWGEEDIAEIFEEAQNRSRDLRTTPPYEPRPLGPVRKDAMEHARPIREPRPRRGFRKEFDREWERSMREWRRLGNLDL